MTRDCVNWSTVNEVMALRGSYQSISPQLLNPQSGAPVAEKLIPRPSVTAMSSPAMRIFIGTARRSASASAAAVFACAQARSAARCAGATCSGT